MKLLFICGCLKPGYDGVGDYTRRLAAELIRNGDSVAILSLNDAYVNEGAIEEVQSDNEVSIPVFRISAFWKSQSRFETVKNWLNNFNPDLISLQYVPFAFHNKGLDIHLVKKLLYIGKGYKWHIMFHELWVGMEKNANLKMKLWGKIQQILITKLLRNLKPAVIHTHIALYKKQLEQIGFNATLLPLYSNIPVYNIGRVEEVPNQLMFLIFGSIYEAALVEELATEAVAYACEYNLNLQLTIIGRSGKGMDLWKTIWLKKGIDVNILGEQPVQVVSEMMQLANIGIATTPSYLVGKSGTVAAMLEHSLPVLNITREWDPNVEMDLVLPAGVIDYQSGKLKEILSNLKPSDSIGNQFKTVFDLFNHAISV